MAGLEDGNNFMRLSLITLLLMSLPAFGWTPTDKSFPQSQFDTNNLQIRVRTGGSTNDGLISSNNAVYLAEAPEWLRSSERIPWRGQVVASESNATNVISFHKINNVRVPGFNIMASFQQQFMPTRSGGHLVFNTLNFPSGLTGYKELLRTNGWRWFVWYDRANATSEGVASTAQFIDDIQTIASWGPDILWIDEYGYYAYLAASILATNTTSIQVMYGIANYTSGGAFSALDAKAISLGGPWRLHATTDVNGWDSIKEHADLVESNAWKFSGPGKFFYIGPEANGNGMNATETASGVVLQAMWGNMFLMGFMNNPIQTYGPYDTITNSSILAIQGDPAVVCARRAYTTNGCWWYVKPITTDGGPSFIVAVINTNAFSTNSSMAFTNLNLGLQQSSFTFNSLSGYSVSNLRTSALIGDAQTSVTASSVGSHDYALFRISALQSPSFQSVKVLSTNVTIDYTTQARVNVNGSNVLYVAGGPGIVRINTATGGGASGNMALEVRKPDESAGSIISLFTSANGTGYGVNRDTSTGYGQWIGYQAKQFTGLQLMAAAGSASVGTEYTSFTGGSWQGSTNAASAWPTAASTPGGFAIVNSNGTVYIFTSSPNSTTWAATNKIAP